MAEKNPMKPIRVYIAGPYTFGDPLTNVLRAIYEANWIIETFPDGRVIPFVPHLYHFWNKQCYHPYEVWTRMDLAWLQTCHVLRRLPGKSPGADDEIVEARRLAMPICFTREELADTIKTYKPTERKERKERKERNTVEFLKS